MSFEKVNLIKEIKLRSWLKASFYDKTKQNKHKSQKDFINCVQISGDLKY
jgi:hypothetical protein